MSVRIIGAIGRPPTGTDADPVQPGLHIAALPYSASGFFGFPLICTVLAVGVFRPVHGEAIPHQPFAEIRIADRACGYRAPVAVETNRIAVQGSPRDEGVEIVCGLRTTPVLLAIFASTELGALGCIDAPEPDAVAVDFQRVAIDDACLADEIIGEAGAAGGPERDSCKDRAPQPSRKSMTATY